MKKIVVVGGGLAGLITSIALVRAGVACTVIEKRSYPQHKVCGEYISNETVPFLKSLGLFPKQFNPPQISMFKLSAINGSSKVLPLDLGGFGISRFTFDHFLYQQAKSAGVEFHLNTEVDTIDFADNRFAVRTSTDTFYADMVVGAYGKRSKLDMQLNRSFIQKRSPYVGVKYHARMDHPDNRIELHNFAGGYCGLSNVEDGKTNICYLTHRDNLKRYGNIKEMETAVLFQNPNLKEIFNRAEFLFEKPETINEISFETKNPVENHILMAGDAAGMIAPLCGNGMAMAIHAAKILSTLLIRFNKETSFTRDALEKEYSKLWHAHFGARLWRGRQVQKLFGNATASKLAVNLTMHVTPLANLIIRNTHGEVF